MAKRPVFVPSPKPPEHVRVVEVEFEWHSGMSLAQKRRSISSLHAAAGRRGIEPVLEISSKSPDDLGVALSAFNLTVRLPSGRSVPLECAFQAAKRFEGGGPFVELLEATPRDAKRDPRLRESGRLVAFELEGRSYPTKPETAFYDHLYADALDQNPELAAAILRYAGFTDIEFNPEKSLNCQARAAARFVGIARAMTDRA